MGTERRTMLNCLLCRFLSLSTLLCRLLGISGTAPTTAFRSANQQVCISISQEAKKGNILHWLCHLSPHMARHHHPQTETLASSSSVQIHAMSPCASKCTQWIPFKTLPSAPMMGDSHSLLTCGGLWRLHGGSGGWVTQFDGTELLLLPLDGHAGTLQLLALALQLLHSASHALIASFMGQEVKNDGLPNHISMHLKAGAITVGAGGGYHLLLGTRTATRVHVGPLLAATRCKVTQGNCEGSGGKVAWVEGLP